MKKKGIELSLSTLVVAILVMVVLVVVVLIFTGGIGELTPTLRGFTDCTTKGGECIGEEKSCGADEMKVRGHGCPLDKVNPKYNEDHKWCCLPEKSFFGGTETGKK